VNYLEAPGTPRSARDLLPWSVTDENLVPGAGLEPAQTFRSDSSVFSCTAGMHCGPGAAKMRSADSKELTRNFYLLSRTSARLANPRGPTTVGSKYLTSYDQRERQTIFTTSPDDLIVADDPAIEESVGHRVTAANSAGIAPN
jgi:hypothetical protein